MMRQNINTVLLGILLFAHFVVYMEDLTFLSGFQGEWQIAVNTNSINAYKHLPFQWNYFYRQKKRIQYILRPSENSKIFSNSKEKLFIIKDLKATDIWAIDIAQQVGTIRNTYIFNVSSPNFK